MFDTKIAILIQTDLENWQKLNVTAFLASGMTAALPDLLGEPYIDAAGREHGRLLGQPMLIFAGETDLLQRVWAKSIERGLVRAAYVRAMFATGHDSANREVFRAEPADAPDLVGLAVYGAKKDVDKVIKGAKLHP
ncbi:DUF2000 domain-containing protein [Paracoccus aminophilus]|uniref:DUF2000 domain-containing protein n=1 Tax=Paracoccus aminophilus JCM 7686 TaxID=1367847 RepID=S5XUH6_PARAH|nr:DUF2000 domain-containing protein [Paracoccus aminophilus]AGT11139.1 hypothetical protein JCM7686_pAMI5p073 [Paracoccus aminophilus JCM 7686]